jgi:shikimate kinase
MAQKRIVILGFMACGKTAVAEALARRLGCHYVDLDQRIAEKSGRSPAAIINQDGERQFRKVETAVLGDLLNDATARVIALGGGTWTISTNRDSIAQHDCATVWLDTPFEICWKRINTTETNRPLAPDRLTALSRYNARRGDYQSAQLHIEAGESDTSEALAARILAKI